MKFIQQSFTGSRRSFVAGLLGLTILTPTAFLALPTPTRADTTRQQGVNITPSSPTSFASADFYQSLKNLKADHANSVNLVFRLAQTSVSTTDIGPTNNTPTDAALVTAIQEAHSLGLTVTLKPHVDPNDGQWRAAIDPADRAQWFQNYDNYLKRYAKIAQDNHVEQFVIGTELIDMTSATHNASNTAYWNGLISDVRAIYSGKLGYAANWGPTGTPLDEKNQIAFWDKLDFAGIDAYYPLTSAKDNSVASLETAWAATAGDVTAFAAKVGKPLIFTEVGYQSTNDAHLAPGIWQTRNGVNDTEQANAYQAFFSYWNSKDILKGIYLWEWQPESAAGGSNDQDYTPQNKPAEAIMATWFAGNGIATPIDSLGLPATTHAVTASAALSNTAIALGQPQTITTTVRNSGNGAENALLIDREIYDANGTKVYQKFSDAESFTQGQAKTYQDTWMPTAAGTYTVQTGVFTSGWGTNYVWNSTAAQFTVSAAAQSSIQIPTLTASATATMVAPGAQTTLQVTVSNTASTISGGLVDVEVYDANGARVLQQFSQDQTITTNDTKQYQYPFIPSAAGTYRIAVGVFSADWSKNYVWVANAGTVTVAAAPVSLAPVAVPVAPTPVAPAAPPVVAPSVPVVLPPAQTTPAVPAPVASTTPTLVTSFVPTPTSGTIDVWWPGTGSSINGVTPFKALVKDVSVDQYDMSWQVDGGKDNAMYDSSDSYPHKEAMVDVSSWNWQDSRLYTLTFTARNTAGTVIATKSVTVSISH